MKALFVTTNDGATLINLDNVERVSVEAVDGAGYQPSLCFSFTGGGEHRFYLDKETKAYKVWDLVRVALVPLYEGRMNMIMGIKLELDLTPLQLSVSRF